MKNKTLKTLLVGFMLAILPISSFAQSAFDKFEDMDGVKVVVVNKSLFSLMSSIGQESDDDYMNLIKGLSELKVFATENQDIAKQMEVTFTTYLKKHKLTELMRVKDGTDIVKMYVDQSGDPNFVNELLMYVNGTENGRKQGVIVSLTGKIDLKQVSKLTAKMNIPGGEHFKDIKTKKQ
ncbi:MAG: DUF4252 domain-containing protein [Flavobacteriales bacterium]|jgi:hypothetical protein|nr:DUF4252 domain-containing protein [Flavobacteriales bacterium]